MRTFFQRRLGLNPDDCTYVASTLHSRNKTVTTLNTCAYRVLYSLRVHVIRRAPHNICEYSLSPFVQCSVENPSCAAERHTRTNSSSLSSLKYASASASTEERRPLTHETIVPRTNTTMKVQLPM